MSEAREDLPPRSTPLPPLGVTGPTQPFPLTPQMGLRLAAGGLRSGNGPAGLDIPFDPQSLRVAAGGAPIVPAAVSSAPPSGGDVYSQAVSYFVGKGLPIHVAQGIADNISRESGGDPVIRGDGGTSVGLFQAHDDRMKSLMSNPNWQTPQAQFDWAWQQMHGGDQIATENFNRIAGSRTREEANQAFKDYFERPAGSPGGQIDAQRAQGQSDLSRIGGEAHAILDEIRKSGGRSQETFKMLADARQKMADYEERALKLAERGPSNDPRDTMQRMGGVATVIGILGGLFTKQPMMASLNAGAAAMEAYNQQDEVAYKANVEQWRTHIDTLQKMGQVQHNMLRDILDDERVSINERLGMAQVTLSALGNERLAEVARLGHEDKLRAEVDRIKTATDKLEIQKDKLDLERQKFEVDPKNIEAKLFENIEAAKGDPEKTKEAMAALSDYNAVHRGTGGARSAQGMFMQTYMHEHPQATSMELAEAMGEYRRIQAIESGFGGGIMGRQVISLNTVADHILRVEEYADALKNGNIPKANAVANYIAKSLGKPEVTNFEAGRDIMADEVVRLLTSTGGTERDREGMQNRLSGMMSPPQFAGVFDVLKGFTGARFEALRQQFSQGDKDREQYFMDRMLTPKGRQVFAAMESSSSQKSGGGAPSIPAAAVEALKAHPDKRADFDAMFGPGEAAKVLGQ